MKKIKNYSYTLCIFLLACNSKEEINGKWRVVDFEDNTKSSLNNLGFIKSFEISKPDKMVFSNSSLIVLDSSGDVLEELRLEILHDSIKTISQSGTCQSGIINWIGSEKIKLDFREYSYTLQKK